MSTEAFKAQMAQFNAEYRAALPGKLAEIMSLWARTPEAAARVELHRLLHSLAGSAKVFGLAPVSAAAREAENAMAPFANDAAEPVGDDHARIAALLEGLHRAAGTP
jgi:chemotaxis protein histidine kinase CheA